MRYLFLSLFSVLILSCNFEYKNSIAGNGNIVTREVKTDSFDKIDVTDALDVVIIPSETQKVLVVADENLVDLITINVRDNTLRISAEKRIQMARSKKIEVYTQTMEKLEASAASTVHNSDSLQYGNFKIMCSSAAQVDLTGRFQLLNIEASSASNIKLSGYSKELRADLSSASGLSAFNLTAENVNIVASSAANAKVHVTHEANFNASSAANISYHGNPSVKNVSTSSGGSVN
jgi:hypothetical protein